MDDILKDLPMVPAPDGPHRFDIRTPLPPTSGAGWAEALGKVEVCELTVDCVAIIAHTGGIAGMTESDVLRAIRKLVLPFWNRKVDREALDEALANVERART